MPETIDLCLDPVAAIFEPRQRLTVSEWAEAERWLSSEDSAEQGKWSNALAPYQTLPMDLLTSGSDYEQIVLMWAAQTGKSGGVIGNFLGYTIATDPGPIMVVQPRLEDAKAWSKDRLAPMLRDTPCLRGKVKDAWSRDAENNLLHKRFPGGSLTICGANSPAALAARSIRYLILDEIDRFPASAGTEGSPESLATKRTATFWNRKILKCSTPTTKGASAIERAYQASDQRSYWVPCPLCGEQQVLNFRRLEWAESTAADAQYRCSGCEQSIQHHQKAWMLSNGEWRAANPGSRIAGFWLSQLYSPFVSWGETAIEFLEAKASPETLRTFINTALCELWDDEKESRGNVDESQLMARCEVYSSEVPAGACTLTCGVDVQDNRIEAEVVGWGPGDESWSVDYRVLPGDPSGPAVWADLDEYLMQTWRHELGSNLKIMAACVDSGGHNTNAVYRFCSQRYGRRVFAIKGRAGAYPIWDRKPGRTGANHSVWHVGVDSAKATIMSWLRLMEAGPGCCHFPAGRTREYFEQMLSEYLKTEYRAGAPVRQWIRKKGREAEALDTRVYALSALEALKALGLRLEKQAELLAAPVPAAKPPVVPASSGPRRSAEEWMGGRGDNWFSEAWGGER